jgi:glutamate 5-kinase
LGDDKSSQGTGGMHPKIEAAAIAKAANIETWVVNGLNDNFFECDKNKIPLLK